MNQLKINTTPQKQNKTICKSYGVHSAFHKWSIATQLTLTHRWDLPVQCINLQHATKSYRIWPTILKQVNYVKINITFLENKTCTFLLRNQHNMEETKFLEHLPQNRYLLYVLQKNLTAQGQLSTHQAQNLLVDHMAVSNTKISAAATLVCNNHMHDNGTTVIELYVCMGQNNVQFCQATAQ